MSAALQRQWPNFSQSRTRVSSRCFIAGSFSSWFFTALAAGASTRCSKVGRDRRARCQPEIDIFIAMSRLLAAFVLAVVAQSIPAQEFKDFGKDRLNSSPRHGEWVDIKSGDRTIKAFVVYPERKDKAPAVLVIQEIFGLTDWLRSMCDELAENGVIAIAPDFLNGQKFEDADGASKATSALTNEQIKTVLDATSDYALTKIPAGSGTLAVCGFCRGGGWAFDYANQNSKLKAAYSFYGTAPDFGPKAKNIACPVYGFYGENDERVNATIPKAEELMKAVGKK